MPTDVAARDAVLDALRVVLGLNPEDAVDERQRPIGDLGFTSPDGLDFVCELERCLGVKVPDKLNPFVDDARRRARTVRQIIEWVEQELPGWSEAVHG